MQKELQRKYMQMQLLQQQLNTFLEEKLLIDEKVSEIVVTVDALQNLGKIKKGDEIWSGLGSGSFVRSDIKDIDKVLISIGAGVVIKEERSRAMEILQLRLAELNQIDKDLVAEINRFTEQINKIESEVQSLAQMENKGKAQ
jgi:prefoldin alpha subunit